MREQKKLGRASRPLITSLDTLPYVRTLHLTHNSDQVQIGKLRVRGYIPSLNICSPPQVAHIFCVYDEMTREPSMQYYK